MRDVDRVIAMLLVDSQTWASRLAVAIPRNQRWPISAALSIKFSMVPMARLKSERTASVVRHK